MGVTNSVQIFQGNVCFILEDEMPDTAAAFMDDVNIKGPPTWYETTEDGWYTATAFTDPPPQAHPIQCASGLDGLFYEVIKENPAIRHFVWDHVNDVNRILQRFKRASGTFSGWKMDLCILEVVAVSHKCTYGGRYPEDQKVQKILDWPDCTSLTEVRGFLGVCGIVRIWVKNFAKQARPLVVPTKKDVVFVWGSKQKEAMEDLKQAIVTAPCLRLIDYHCDRMVILAIDSSCIVTSFILLQLGADGKWYPSRFGSITWNERESCYSQAKIEIYGLWHALQAYRLYIIGVKNLQVEIDMSYIKGMLNNLDIQPSAAVNMWIVGIKLFHFELM